MSLRLALLYKALAAADIAMSVGACQSGLMWERIDGKWSKRVTERGHVRNLLSLYHHSTDWEKREGAQYYDVQAQAAHGRSASRSTDTDICLIPPTACWRLYASSRPNQTEKTNYQALSRCLKIATGRLPEDASVSAYGKQSGTRR